MVQIISSIALTICTHVVANMPPKITYTIIRMPTLITAVLKLMPESASSRRTSAPAPTICAIM
jgi:hypothetical protein